MAPILPPDHKPLASPLDGVKKTAPRSALTITVTAYGLCPTTLPLPRVEAAVGMVQAAEQADDPPQEDFLAPVSYRLDRGVSTTADPAPFVQNNWPVPQRRSSNEHLMMYSTSAALLHGDAASTLDWLPTYPTSIVG
jgi:hypothetical protein